MDWPDLSARLDRFVAERKWDRYHTPKDLALALNVEAAELVEVFQWRDPGWNRVRDGDLRQPVEDEVADVLLYAFHLCRGLGTDPYALAAAKLARNEARFPPGWDPEP